uniref:C-type lectin domain-containing protein n=1 Tax=Lepisosteus oculatus TaxID=7918 RepID=W5MMB5_LEPOC
SPPCRRTAVCLALLCAVLLAAIIALCVYYYTGSRAGMKGELDELRSKDSTLAYKHSEGVCVCCPEGWKQFKSKCYYFSTDLLNWTDSRAACRKQGADLLTIRTQEEQEFIWNRLDKRNYWIGLTDAAAEGIWLWVDGTHPNPSFWRKDQPDDYHNEDCATIDSDPPAAPHESWNDLTCTKKQLWICETSLFA